MVLLACLPLLLGSKDPLLYQVSAFEALKVGHYDGSYQVRDLTKLGGFGLGTFNELDGEMIVLDGKTYRVNGFGEAAPPAANAKTPFAFVCRFDQDHGTTRHVSNPLSKQEVQAWVDNVMSDSDGIVAIRLDGAFTKLEARSFAPQQKPYLPFAKIGDRQSLFHYGTQAGTFVGFRMPKSVGTLNVPGYHFHFLTPDRRHGGHVLDFGTFVGDIRVIHIARIVPVSAP